MSITVKIGAGAIAQAALASQHAAEDARDEAEAFAASAAESAAKLSGTSTTTTSIGAVDETRTFTTQPNKEFGAGARLTIASTDTPLATMSVISTAYDSETGVLQVTIKSTSGAGTFSSWRIAVTGEPGPQGEQGITGQPGTPVAGFLAGSAVTRGIPIYADVRGKALLLLDPIASPVVLRQARGQLTGVLHIWIEYGQSNAAVTPEITGATPAVNRTPILRDRLWMFESCGLTGVGGSTDITTLNLRRIVDAKESGRESYITARMAQLFAYEDANGLAAPKRFALNTGQGGFNYNQLKQGTLPYNNTLNGVQALYNQYKGNVIVEAICLDQGEADADKDQATRTTQLETWYDNFNTDLKAITGQTTNIPLYCVNVPIQTSGLGAGCQAALLALHRAAVASSSARRIFMTATRYQWYYADAKHVIPICRVYSGAEQAQSIAALTYGSGNNGQPGMLSAARSGNSIIVTTDALYDLAVGSTIAWPDSGFVVRNGSGVRQTITGPVTASGVTVTIPVASPQTDWSVTYAQDTMGMSLGVTGSGGSVHDTRTDVYCRETSVHLYKWLAPGSITGLA